MLDAFTFTRLGWTSLTCWASVYPKLAAPNGKPRVVSANQGNSLSKACGDKLLCRHEPLSSDFSCACVSRFEMNILHRKNRALLLSLGSLNYFAWSSILRCCSSCLYSCVSCMCPWLILPPCKLWTPSFDWLGRIAFTPLPLPHECALGSNLSSTLCLCRLCLTTAEQKKKKKKKLRYLNHRRALSGVSLTRRADPSAAPSTRPEDHRHHSACQIPPHPKKKANQMCHFNTWKHTMHSTAQ